MIVTWANRASALIGAGLSRIFGWDADSVTATVIVATNIDYVVLNDGVVTAASGADWIMTVAGGAEGVVTRATAVDA